MFVPLRSGLVYPGWAPVPCSSQAGTGPGHPDQVTEPGGRLAARTPARRHPRTMSDRPRIAMAIKENLRGEYLSRACTPQPSVEDRALGHKNFFQVGRAAQRDKAAELR